MRVLVADGAGYIGSHACGTAIRDYIHADDWARTHIPAMRHLADGGAGGTFNPCTGPGYRVLEIITAFEKHAGCRVPAGEKGRRLGDPMRLVAGAARATEAVGWCPAHGLDSIVATAWVWECVKAQQTRSVLQMKGRR